MYMIYDISLCLRASMRALLFSVMLNQIHISAIHARAAGGGARGRRGARRACRDLAETQTDLAHLAGEILERTAPVGLRGRGEGKEQYKSLSTPIIFRPGATSPHTTQCNLK